VTVVELVVVEINQEKLEVQVVVEVAQEMLGEQEILRQDHLSLKVPLVELHPEHLIQLELVVVEQHKQDKQVLDQETLQDQEVQEHQIQF
jgi:hypothetical protein